MDKSIISAMTVMVEIFNKYSGKEGDKYTLNHNEFRELINTEFKEVKGAVDQAGVDKIFSQLDQNSDKAIDFKEYITLIAYFTVLIHEFFKEQQQQKKQ